MAETWQGDLRARVGSLDVSRRLRWPDGVADGSGVDHEPEMLDFLRARPRTR